VAHNLDKRSGLYLPTQYGYDAVVDKKRRQAPRASIKNEDDELDQAKRKKLVATSKDQARNISFLAWAIRKHLDYVSAFTFHPQTGNAELDKRLEFLMEDWSGKNKCDAARRHSLRRMIRLFEATKVLDGDCGLIRHENGKLQGLEGSRISKPTGGLPPEYAKCTEHGLILDQFGGVETYIACSRAANSDQLRFDQAIPASKMTFGGYFGRFDQSRGISPLASALNTCQDLYEVFDYVRIKQKMHAMFGVAIYSDAVAATDGWNNTDRNTDSAPTSATSKYDFELVPGLKLELEKGDKIDTIESETPAASFIDYSALMIQISILCLDFPFTFFDSRKSSYSAMRQDRVEYEISAKDKRKDNQEALYEITDWKLAEWVAAGLISLPAGMTVESIPYDWRPAGTPWIDELAEVQAAQMRIASGLSSRTREAKSRGEDFLGEILPELAREEAAIIAAGVTIVTGQPGQPTTRDEEKTLPEDAP
jgi:capsid protein